MKANTNNFTKKCKKIYRFQVNSIIIFIIKEPKHFLDRFFISFFNFSEHIEEIENDKGEGHNSLHHSKPHQIGSGQTSEEQIGLGESATTNLIENNEFLSKIAYLVTKKIYPRLPESTWSNFNLTLPNSTAIESENTVAPLHYDNIKQKNDENDIYGVYKKFKQFKVEKKEKFVLRLSQFFL